MGAGAEPGAPRSPGCLPGCLPSVPPPPAGTSIVFDMSLTYILVALVAVLLNNALVERLSLHTRITAGTLPAARPAPSVPSGHHTRLHPLHLTLLVCKMGAPPSRNVTGSTMKTGSGSWGAAHAGMMPTPGEAAVCPTCVPGPLLSPAVSLPFVSMVTFSFKVQLKRRCLQEVFQVPR